MKIEILESPREKLLELVSKTRREIKILAPFYDEQMVANIIRNMPTNVRLRVLTRADLDSDVGALKKMIQWGEVRAIRNLHAKIFIFDNSEAIVSSANLDSTKNIEVGVLFAGKSRLVKRLNNIFEKWWKKGERIDNAKVKELGRGWARRRRTVEREPRITFGKKVPIQERIERFEPSSEHLILNINWSPRGYERACTKKEATRNICCHERAECLKEEDEWWKYGGCSSSNLFNDFKYATSKNAIEKDRLVFFIAKNPNINNRYYFVGFLYIKSSKHLGKAWGKRLFHFEGDKEKSIQFPSSGKRIIEVSKDFIKELGSLRGNPKYISSEDAIEILREYYRRTGDVRAKTILKENFTVKV